MVSLNYDEYSIIMMLFVVYIILMLFSNWFIVYVIVYFKIVDKESLLVEII